MRRPVDPEDDDAEDDAGGEEGDPASFDDVPVYPSLNQPPPLSAKFDLDIILLTLPEQWMHSFTGVVREFLPYLELFTTLGASIFIYRHIFITPPEISLQLI